MTKLTDIYQRYKHHSGGGDKGTVHNYLELYETFIDRNGSLLEIGVFKGHSLAMFSEYMRGDVIGLDVNLKLVQFDVVCFQVDATNKDDVTDLLRDTTWTHIIDDGSHRLAEQLRSLEILWPYLEQGGKYFIEDIESDHALRELVEYAKGLGAVWIFDMRNVQGQPDDLMMMITKGGGV